MRTPRALLALACLAACDPAPTSIKDLAPGDAWVSAEPAPVTMRRLTSDQLENVLADLFGDGLAIPALAEPEVAMGGLRSVGAGTTTFGARGVESVEEIGFAVAEQVLAPEVEAWFIKVPLTEPGAIEAAISAVGRRAWRRPLTGEEGTRLATIAEQATATLGSPREGLVYAIAALLQSPNFLFRIELGEDGPNGRRFTDLELASRLSFLLWNTLPDDALLAAAEAGELTTDQGLFDQASRMLADDRARQGVRAFFTDQLELYELDHMEKDPTVFEHFSDLLGADAREETLRLLSFYALDVDADFRDVFTTQETFVNPRLAAIYGVPAPVEGDFGYTLLPDDGGRVGLLGQVSFLAHEAHPVGSSATLRGAAIRKRLLCHNIPPPPADVDTSIPEPSGTAPTLRDRVAEHLENPACAGCHKLTDPIGLGLENFDGIGRWRDDDNGTRIDASGDIDAAPFAGPRELAYVLRDHEDLPGCFVRTLSRYASGHVEASGEQAWLDLLSERFAVHGYQVEPLILELVMSPLFRQPGQLAEEN